MRERDLDRVRAHVAWHREKPRRDAMSGDKIMWSYIKFADWALSWMEDCDSIDASKGKPVPGGAACNKKDAG